MCHYLRPGILNYRSSTPINHPNTTGQTYWHWHIDVHSIDFSAHGYPRLPLDRVTYTRFQLFYWKTPWYHKTKARQAICRGLTMISSVFVTESVVQTTPNNVKQCQITIKNIIRGRVILNNVRKGRQKMSGDVRQCQTTSNMQYVWRNRFWKFTDTEHIEVSRELHVTL